MLALYAVEVDSSQNALRTIICHFATAPESVTKIREEYNKLKEHAFLENASLKNKSKKD